MFKIVDLLNGKTVVGQIDLAFIENNLSQAFAVQFQEGFPQDFWLSDEAVAGLEQDHAVI